MATIHYDFTEADKVESLRLKPTENYYNKLQAEAECLIYKLDGTKSADRLQLVNTKNLESLNKRIKARIVWKKQNMRSTLPVVPAKLFNDLVPFYLELCENIGKVPYVNRLATWCGIPAEYIEVLPTLAPVVWNKYKYNYELLESAAAVALMDQALEGKNTRGAELIMTHFFGKMSAKESKKLEQEQQRIEIARDKKRKDHEELQGALSMNIMRAIFGVGDQDE